VAGAELPAETPALAAASDSVLLDARVPGALGGTGVTLAWTDLARSVRALLGDAPFVLAGGLTPQNVATAIAALAPAAVDVSSGVERSPGIKDAERMRAFVAAVREASRPPDRPLGARGP
jgi:phosphoribosylanthranilate isomerase